MTRATIMLLAVAAVLAASSAFARIGETEAEIIVRYGKPLTIPSQTIQGQSLKVFRAADLRVGVAFIDGKSAAEFYSKQDGGEISGTEIDVILKANSAGSKWKLSASEFGLKTWVLEAGGRTVSYMSKALIITTEEYTKASEAWTAKQAKERLKGF